MDIQIKKQKEHHQHTKKNNFVTMILPFFIVILFMMVTKVTHSMGNLGKKDNISKLVSLESKDISAIEAKILAIREEMKPNIGSGEPADVRVAFENTIFMGDSITEGLSEYEVLNPSSVMAIKGRTVSSALEDVEIVANLNPSNIVMFYGMNDMLAFNSANEFIKAYEVLVNSLKERLPNANIYINSVFPTNDNASSKEPKFNKYGEFNLALEEMCTRLNIKFMNTEYILKEDPTLYEQDGIHMVYKFYIQWLDIIRDIIGV